MYPSKSTLTCVLCCVFLNFKFISSQKNNNKPGHATVFVYHWRGEPREVAKKFEEVDYKPPLKLEEEEVYKNQEEGQWSGSPLDGEILEKVEEEEKKTKKPKKPKKPKLKEPVEIKAPEFSFEAYGKMREPSDEGQSEEQNDRKRGSEGEGYEDSEQATEQRIIGHHPIDHRSMMDHQHQDQHPHQHQDLHQHQHQHPHPHQHQQPMEHRAIDEQPMEHREMGGEQQGPNVHYESVSSQPEAPITERVEDQADERDERDEREVLPDPEPITPNNDAPINSNQFADQPSQVPRYHPHVDFYARK